MATVSPTVVPRSRASRLSSMWVAASIRTLVLCMQISIQMIEGSGVGRPGLEPGTLGLKVPCSNPMS